MKIAFLNLCHCDPQIVARAAKKLTSEKDFHMYVHVDAKSDIKPFESALSGTRNIHLLTNREKIYWGGFNAIHATIKLLKEALSSEENFQYFVTLQNLDYPLWSNERINEFFEKSNGTEYIRGCNIANTSDSHYKKKFKIYNQRDNDFYLKKHSRLRMYLRYLHMMLMSVNTMLSKGIIKENKTEYKIHYGAAQWAITRECANYIVEFYESHKKFNKVMSHIQFPDEEYFHTIVHNSEFKYKCSKFDEEEKRWLVNWRNLHYFEFPKAVKVFDEKDYNKIIEEDSMFIRKVKSNISDTLLDMIDKK
jgi:hypothetical protein